MTRQQLVERISHLIQMNDQLRSSVGYWRDNGGWMQVNGVDSLDASIAKWEDIIAKNERLIAAYKAELDKLG